MRLTIRASLGLSLLCLTNFSVHAQEPQCQKAVEAGDHSRMERYCSHLKISSNVAVKKSYYFLLGLAQFENSDNNSASPLFRRALENVNAAIAMGAKTPSDADIYSTRGIIYLQNKPAGEVISKDADKAVKDFSMAISLKPRQARYYYYRGLAYNQLLKPNEAWADFQKARTLDPLDREIESAWQKQRQITPEGRAETQRRLGVEPRDGEIGRCTGRISKIEKEHRGTTIKVLEGQTCTNGAIIKGVIDLGSRPPPAECVVGATVTAKGRFAEGYFLELPTGEFSIEAVTEIACR
jgi:tetratricopeptide (TPR) repeat protein